MGFSTSRLKPQNSALPWRERSPLSSLVLVLMEQGFGNIAGKTGDEQDGGCRGLGSFLSWDI